MPEIWVPYGNVESLVTVQAENLGVVAETAPESSPVDTGRAAELVKGASEIFVSDATPATVELLRVLIPTLTELQTLKLFSAAPKRIEGGIPELKGKVTTLPPPVPSAEGDEAMYASQLLEPGAKLFLGSARPDPLFGLVDTKVGACLNWIAHSQAVASQARKGMEPEPLKKTEAYDAVEGLAEQIRESTFLTAVPRGGKLRAVMENAPFDAIKNAFAKMSMPQTRGMVIGAGGRGYDDTFSSALRAVWSVIEGVRRTGTVLLIAECPEGMGSTALEMLVTGRLAGEGERKKERYVAGLEEVFYLNKLKDEYDVLLLSGLPETYARSKLGLTTAKGAGEAVGRMLNKVGRSGKLNVVTRASECIVESG